MPPTPIFDRVTSDGEEYAVCATTNTLDTFLGSLQRAKDSVIVNYPTTGDKDLPTGTHTFDFKERRVYLSDGTIEHMYTSAPIDVCRSLLLHTDSEIDVKLYLDSNKVYETGVDPEWTRNSNIKFDEMVVTTQQPTMFHLQACDRIGGVWKICKSEYDLGNPYINRGAVAIAGTYVELDVRASLGHKAHNGWIANMGTTAGVLRVYNYDGISWTTVYYTIPVDAVENLAKCDISRLRIDSDVNNTTFEVNLR